MKYMIYFVWIAKMSQDRNIKAFALTVPTCISVQSADVKTRNISKNLFKSLVQTPDR